VSQDALEASQSPAFSARLLVDGERALLVLSGEADLAVLPELDARLAGAPSTVRTVVVDAATLAFIDASVVGWLEGLRRRGLAVRVRGAHGIVRRVLDLVAFDAGTPSV